MSYPNTQEPELSYEERVRMRRHLDMLDQKEAGTRKEFDLNRPPVPPYHFREYPFLMYHHPTKQARAAQNHEQRQKMLAEGWSEDPVPIQTPEVELTASEILQASEIDRRLKMPKEQLETEQSAEYMAGMRARIDELESQLAQRQEPEPEETETQTPRKRSKS